MKTRDLKSLCESIATTVDATEPKKLAEGYINSLTEKARQVYSSTINEEEDEKEETPAEERAEDKAESVMKKLAAKALKRAKKKAAMNEEIEEDFDQLDEVSLKKKIEAFGDRATREFESDDDPTNYTKDGESKSDRTFRHILKHHGERAALHAHRAATSKIFGRDRLKPMKKGGKKAATNEEVELAEKAAPGYEDWASDPKVKASFKKQYGNRWKQVMYGRSWNMKKMDESEQLDEISDTLLFRARAKAKGVGKFKVRKNSSFAGSSKDVPLHKKITKELQRRGSVPVSESEQLEEGYQAKRLRMFRKGKPLNPETAVFMKRSFKRKVTRDNVISGGKGSVRALDIRTRKKAAALKAKGLAEDTLEEGILKKLRRAKGAAYDAMQKGKGDKYAKLHGVASGLESRYKAKMARRGGASPEAIKGAGSRLGPSGKYTLKAGRLATQHDKAVSGFRTKVRTAELFGRETDKGAKRQRQQAQAEFANKARSGDFGQNNQEALRARSNFQKRYGRLKGK